MLNKEPENVSEKFFYNTEFNSGSGWVIGPALSLNLGYRF
jgi:hypothetical protein